MYNYINICIHTCRNTHTGMYIYKHIYIIYTPLYITYIHINIEEHRQTILHHSFESNYKTITNPLVPLTSQLHNVSANAHRAQHGTSGNTSD
jgi:hypothetical protein